MARQYGSESESARKAAGELEAEKERRSAAVRKTERIAGMAMLAVGGLFLVFSLFKAVVVVPGQVQAYEQAYIQFEEAYNETKAEYEATGGHRTRYETPEMNSAKHCGEAIAGFQNRLSPMRKAWKDSGSQEKPADYLQCLLDYQNWLESSVGAENMDAWSETGTWIFNNTYDYVGEGSYVVWSCYGFTDTARQRPLMFVVGYYNPSSAKISSMTTYRTEYYENYLKGESGTSLQPEGNAPPDQAGDPSIGEPNEPEAVDDAVGDSGIVTDGEVFSDV